MAKKSFDERLDGKLETWSNEECLFNFSKFFERVGLSTEFIQDTEGLIVAQVLVMNVGDKKIVSEPQMLEWPLQPVPLPEDAGVKLN